MSKILENKIKLSWNHMTKSEREISQRFIDQKINLLNYSITKLANALGTNVSAINRWTKALGYDGYKSLFSQYKLQEQTSIKYDDGFSVIQKDIIYSISTTEYFVSYKDMDVLAKQIIKMKNVTFYGEGFGKIISDYYAYMFNKIGIESRVMNVSSDIALIHNVQNTVNIFTSFSGNNPNIALAFERAQLTGEKFFSAIVTTNLRSLLNKKTNVELVAQFHQTSDINPFELPIIVNTTINYIFQKLFLLVYSSDDLPYKKLINKFKS